MKSTIPILLCLILISCVDVKLPELKTDEVPETDKAKNPEDSGTGEASPEQTPAANTYPLIISSSIPADVLPYISLFIYYGNMFGMDLNYSNLIITFENNVKGSYVGQCSSINGNKNKLIKINNDMWPSLSPSYREQLIFHEASHCILGRAHKGNNFYSPESIMNPSLFPDYIYIQRYNEFIYELFGTPVMEDEYIFGAMIPNE